jgi:hypothetical protein
MVTNRPDRSPPPAAADAPAAVENPPSTALHHRPGTHSTTKPKTTRIAASMRRSLQSGAFPAISPTRSPGGDGERVTAAGGQDATTDELRRALADEPGVPSTAKTRSDTSVFGQDLATATPGSHDSTGSPAPPSTHFHRRRQGADSISIVKAIKDTLRTAARSSVVSQEIHLSKHRSSAESARSQIEEDLRHRIACPECGAAYPFEDALIGQMMRCRGCHSVFRIFEGGQTAAAIVNRPRPAAQRSRVQRNAKESLGLPDIDAELEELPAAPAKPKPKPRRQDGARASRIMRTKDLIAEMNQKLVAVGDKIEDPSPAPANAGRQRRSSTAVERVLPPSRPNHRQVRLTGEGRAASLLRWLWLGAAGLGAALAYLLVTVFGGATPEQQALADLAAGCSYHRPDEARRTIDLIAQRAWHTPAMVQPVIVDDATVFAAPWRVDMGCLAALRQAVVDRFLHEPTASWIPRAARDRVEELWQQHRDNHQPAETFDEVLRQAGIDRLPHADLLGQLDALPLPAETREVLRLAFADRSGSGGFFQEEFILKGLPQAMEGRAFHGKHGRLILPTGATLVRDYTGMLLRLHRDGTQGPWKVFRLETLAP